MSLGLKFECFLWNEFDASQKSPPSSLSDCSIKIPPLLS